MVQPLLFVCSLFAICNFPMCSAGNPGTSDRHNESRLENILKAGGWKKLVPISLGQKLRYNNGGRMDVSDLLSQGSERNVVSSVNYADKLQKSSTIVNCFYCENIMFMNDYFTHIIMRQCIMFSSAELMLDCMERYWHTTNVHIKSLTEKMLKVLYFFYEAPNTTCPRDVIDVLELLIPHLDHEKYKKMNYLDNNGAVEIDNFMMDYIDLIKQIHLANKLLRIFLKDRCLPTLEDKTLLGDHQRDEHIRAIKEMLAIFELEQRTDVIFKTYTKSLLKIKKMFLTELGFDKE